MILNIHMVYIKVVVVDRTNKFIYDNFYLNLFKLSNIYFNKFLHFDIQFSNNLTGRHKLCQNYNARQDLKLYSLNFFFYSNLFTN